jgi:hypothetical protein
MTTFDHAVEEQMKAFDKLFWPSTEDYIVASSVLSGKREDEWEYRHPATIEELKAFLHSFASTIRDAVREEEQKKKSPDGKKNAYQRMGATPFPGSKDWEKDFPVPSLEDEIAMILERKHPECFYKPTTFKVDKWVIVKQIAELVRTKLTALRGKK